MGLLDQDELAKLSIDRIIFHIVGRQDSDLILMDEIEIDGFESFFLDRVREANVGNRFTFIGADSGIAPALKAIEADPAQFVEKSKELAMVFHQAHKPTTSARRGAFIVARVVGGTHSIYSLIKIDDTRVLRFLEEIKEGKRRAKLSEIGNTFVEDKKAVQKSALIVLSGDKHELAIFDRNNRTHITDYFKSFLGVARMWTAEASSKRLRKAIETAFTAHQGEAPEELRSNWRKRMAETVAKHDSVDPGEDFDKFGAMVLGPFWSHEKFQQSLQKEMHAQRISGESIVFDKRFFPVPRIRRIKTSEGITIRVPTDLENQQHLFSIDGPENGPQTIVIKTAKLAENELEAENTGKVAGS